VLENEIYIVKDDDDNNNNNNNNNNNHDHLKKTKNSNVIFLGLHESNV